MNFSFCGLYRLATLCLILLISALMTSPLLAVDCTSADIDLNSQAAIDDFQLTYGPCDTVTGVLTIDGADIANVGGLSALTSVGDSLQISNNAALTNLNGLSALTSVGGYLSIYINAALTNLDGLSALTSVGRNLIILNNAVLTNLNDLSALTSVGGYLHITSNDTLTNVDGLSALTSVGGELKVTGNAVLTDVDGLSALTSVSSNLEISENDVMTNVDGLSALTSVGGYMTFTSNAVLTNLDGLSALTSVGSDLTIQSNAALTNVDGLSALTSVGGYLYINNNAALTNLNGLSALTSLGDDLTIQNNAVLANVDGLSALTSLGDFLNINNNTALTNLDGLSSLISVGTDVTIQNNPQLAVCYALAPLLDDVDDALPGPGPGAAGIPDVGGDVFLSNNLPGCNTVAQILAVRPPQGTAVLAIQKRFSDGNNDTPVTLNLQCSTGSYAPASVTVYPDDAGQPWGDYGMIEHIFVVSQIALVNGEGATCTVMEEPVAGYATEYKCPPADQLSTADPSCVPDGYTVPEDNYACAWSDVQEGDSNYCLIVNDPLPAEVAVTKVWDVSNTGGEYVSRDAEIKIGCSGEIVDSTWEKGNWSYKKFYLGEGDYTDGMATVTVQVIPDYPSSECFAVEDDVDSSVEVTSDCGSWNEGTMEVSAGEGDSCTITNTLFFEGIPTLNQYGLALMALLMLGMGMVGVRRFV